MKTKIAVIFSLVAAVAVLFCIGGTAFADEAEQELNDNILSILDGLDMSALEEYLQNHENDFLFTFGDSAREIVEYLVRGNLSLDYSSYLGELFSVLFENVLPLLPAFLQIIALSII